MSKAALGDKDEWVGTIARAVGTFGGRLDLDAVVAGSSAVRPDCRLFPWTWLTIRATSAIPEVVRVGC